jgi:Excreted virulence factor EspC, type VII ESX diderm
MGRMEVIPYELERSATRIGDLAADLADALPVLARVQEAGPAADSPLVAAALTAVSNAWGTSLVGLDVSVSTLAGKLHAAAQEYVCTDARVADWTLHTPFRMTP